MRKAIVLGMGISGKAAAEFLLKRNFHVIGVDKLPLYVQEVEMILENDPIDFSNADFLVKSPGIGYSHPIVQEAMQKKIPVLGEVDLALQEIKNKTVYAITGSNGKTTTTLFTTHLLKCAGKKAISVGNIGTPLLSQLESDAEIFVIELSSFQLEKIYERPVFDKAVILNITPNHLDRHSSFEEYARAKFRIQSCMKEKGEFYVSQVIKDKFSIGDRVYDVYKEKIETIFSLSYRDGRFFSHDLENFSAGFALAGVSIDAFEKGLNDFKKPPHRIEFVQEINGVVYINDSKATSVDATTKAVSCIEKKLIMIVGGVDKGGSFYEWIPHFKEKVIKAFAMGPAAIRIFKELEGAIDVEAVSNLHEAFLKAVAIAKAGDAVLLSPGCASYNEFKDYQHRGDKFKELVCQQVHSINARSS